MIELRPQQRKCCDEGLQILNRHCLLYLAAEVRTGKTLMSMTIAKEAGWTKVLFVTKKMAISSVQADLVKFGHQFIKFDIVNYENVHKLISEYNGYIIDEATTCGAYPKPGVRTKDIKKLTGKMPVILLSGTPTPEGYSQIFHQFWVSYYSPFSIFKNFYEWAKEYVNVKKKWIRGFQISDYSDAKSDKIKEVIKHYMVTLSQEEAGFQSMVEEEILFVDINPQMYILMDWLKKHKVYKMKNGRYLVADSAVKMQNLFHQISSGTVIAQEDLSSDPDDREKTSFVLDESKVKFIKQKFVGKKIAIFYKFVKEGELLRKWFPNHTDSPEQFNTYKDVTFICQIVSGRMGVDLRTADCLVMYNIDFSATSYFQARARMQSHGRTTAAKLYWIFSEGGLEMHVYNAVARKKSFTLDYFKKYLNESDGSRVKVAEKSAPLFKA